MPKPIKVPSLARSVHKLLKVPSLVRSVLKHLKEPKGKFRKSDQILITSKVIISSE